MEDGGLRKPEWRFQGYIWFEKRTISSIHLLHKSKTKFEGNENEAFAAKFTKTWNKTDFLAKRVQLIPTDKTKSN